MRCARRVMPTGNRNFANWTEFTVAAARSVSGMRTKVIWKYYFITQETRCDVPIKINWKITSTWIQIIIHECEKSCNKITNIDFAVSYISKSYVIQQKVEEICPTLLTSLIFFLQPNSSVSSTLSPELRVPYRKFRDVCTGIRLETIILLSTRRVIAIDFELNMSSVQLYLSVRFPSYFPLDGVRILTSADLFRGARNRQITNCRQPSV